MVDFHLRPIELDDQERLHVERIAGMHEFLGGLDRRLVHHLHAARDDAGADDAADALAGILRGCESDQQRAGAFRLPEDAHGHLGDDAEETLRAVDDAEKVVAAGVEMPAADAHDVAVHQHDLAAKHVVRGHAVFEAVHAA